MKYIIVLFLFIPLFISAQDEFEPIYNGQVAQRIKSMRVAFITNKLDLTPEQSQSFWPIYNAFDVEQNNIKKSARVNKSINSMSDVEIEELIDKRLTSEQALLDAKKAYYKKLKSVVSVRQIALLNKAEREFKTFLLKELQKRRNNGGKHKKE